MSITTWGWGAGSVSAAGWGAPTGDTVSDERLISPDIVDALLLVPEIISAEGLGLDATAFAWSPDAEVSDLAPAPLARTEAALDAAAALALDLRPEISSARSSDEDSKTEVLGLTPSISSKSSEQFAEGSARELAPDIVDSEEN